MRRAIRERNVLFLDQDNACSSQMAEAVAKYLGPPKVRIYSAGVTPGTIPMPVRKVMQELGISMLAQKSTMNERRFSRTSDTCYNREYPGWNIDI